MKKFILPILFFMMFIPNVVFAKSIKIGDYVFLVPDLDTYTVPSDITGFEPTAQLNNTIQPNELKLWRVININNDGTFDLVSEYISSRNVVFSGTIGYANLIGGLQLIASKYANEEFTVNTRMMGYDGQTLTIDDTSRFDGSISTLDSLVATGSPIEGNGFENSNGVLGDTLYLKDIQLVGNVYKNNPEIYGDSGLISYKVSSDTPYRYWLASRVNDFDGGKFVFGGRNIYNTGILTYTHLRDYSPNDSSNRWRDNYFTNRVRPIITIKSNIKVVDGLGSKDDPFIISSLKNSNITIVNDDNIGSIKNIKMNDTAEEASIVLFSVIPKKEYKLESINIIDEKGNRIEYKKTDKENEYEFIMPDKDVTITPIYKKIESINVPDTLKNPNTGTGISMIIITTLLLVSSITYIIFKRKKNYIMK